MRPVQRRVRLRRPHLTTVPVSLAETRAQAGPVSEPFRYVFKFSQHDPNRNRTVTVGHRCAISGSVRCDGVNRTESRLYNREPLQGFWDYMRDSDVSLDSSESDGGGVPHSERPNSKEVGHPPLSPLGWKNARQGCGIGPR